MGLGLDVVLGRFETGLSPAAGGAALVEGGGVVVKPLAGVAIAEAVAGAVVAVVVERTAGAGAGAVAHTFVGHAAVFVPVVAHATAPAAEVVCEQE